MASTFFWFPLLLLKVKYEAVTCLYLSILLGLLQSDDVSAVNSAKFQSLNITILLALSQATKPILFCVFLIS